MRTLRPLPYVFRRRPEQLVDTDSLGVDGKGLQRVQHRERHEYGARPIRDLVEMERKPARQKHDLDRHHRHAAPRDYAIKREQIAGEHIAVGRAATLRIHVRAWTICGASTGSPIIFRAK